jgi:uncharacterized membrane protein YedE/YeeE
MSRGFCSELLMLENVGIPLLGGMLIGAAATLLLLFYGKIFGVSGIVGGLIKNEAKDYDWRIAIVLGFLVGGAILYVSMPGVFTNTAIRPTIMTIIAGLLVGYGTSLGNGCTSGHGICGLSRFSPRSLVAVLVFMGAGVISVAIQRFVFGVTI